MYFEKAQKGNHNIEEIEAELETVSEEKEV